MRTILLALLASLWATAACAYPVGERQVQATNPTAALRDAQHRDALRVTVWYPANDLANEQDIVIGPP
ncbi:MAG: hypothetical protein KIS90_05535, partial [Phenylobacterium sp.]|nr:hypothetical protein [Phenylobacterium sp.]